MTCLCKIYNGGTSDVRRTAKGGMSLLVGHTPAEPQRSSVGSNRDMGIAYIPSSVHATPNIRIVNSDGAYSAIGHRQADGTAVEVGPRKKVVPFLLNPRTCPQEMARKGPLQARVRRRSRVIGFGKGHHLGGECDTVAQQHRKSALPRAAGLPAPNVLPPR
jgi:hypothetical protein